MIPRAEQAVLKYCSNYSLVSEAATGLVSSEGERSEDTALKTCVSSVSDERSEQFI